mgnify:CR=1 FL=1
MILMKTNFGDVKIELFTKEAPITTENFLSYVKEGFYDGTIFHRVINGFMVQGGGFEPGMKQKPTKDPIAIESKNGLKNEVGTLAMARTNDPNSATCQFFINIANNDFLNFTAENAQGWGYAVFGKVVEGMEVVNQMKAVTTTMAAGHRDVPAEDIVIESMEIIEE